MVSVARSQLVKKKGGHESWMKMICTSTKLVTLPLPLHTNFLTSFFFLLKKFSYKLNKECTLVFMIYSPHIKKNIKMRNKNKEETQNLWN